MAFRLTNSLQDSRTALQQLVAFAEGDTAAFPVLVLKTGEGLVVPSGNALKQVAAMTPRAIEVLQMELRAFLRAAAVDSASLQPIRIKLIVGKQLPDTAPHGRRARRARRAVRSLLIDAEPRDLIFDQTIRVLVNAELDALQVCPGCGKAFVIVTRKRFCSTPCQSRLYMRQLRAAERAERDALLRKGLRHGKTTRTR
jgi:hypothetical protein